MASRGGKQTRIGGIVIDILGNSVGFQRELKNVDRTAARFAASFKREWGSAGKAIGSTTSSLLSLKSALVGITGAAGVGALVKNTLDYADAVTDASDALGLSTKAYQEISFAAAQAGIGQDKFTASFSKFVQLAQGYATGDKSDAFARLGISAKEAAGDAEALFNLVVDQLDKLPTQNERLSVIGELFGKKTATAWAATFAGGAAGLEEMRAKADEFVGVLSDVEIRALGSLGDQIDAIKTKFQVAFAKGLIEGLTDQTGDLTEPLKDPEVVTALNNMGEGFRILGEEVGKIPARIEELKASLSGLREYEGLAVILAGGFAGAKVGRTIGGAAGKTMGFGIGAAAAASYRQSGEDADSIRNFQAWRAAQMFPGAEDIGPVYPGDVGVPPLLALPEAPAPRPNALGGRPLGVLPPPGSKAAREAEKAQARIDEFVASLKAEVAGLEMEAAALGLSTEAQQEAGIQKELLNTLTDRGIALGSQEAAQVEEAIRQKAALTNAKGARELLDNLDAEVALTREQIAALGMLTEARVREQVISEAEASARAKGLTLSATEVAQLREKAAEIGKLAKLQEDAADVRQNFEDAARIIGAGFEDAILNGEKLTDVLGNIAEALARMALQKMVLEPLVNAAGTAGSAFWRTVVGTGAKSAAVDSTSVAKALAYDPSAAAAAAFDPGAQAKAMPTEDVNSAPEVNVFVQAPQGHSASVGKKQNGSGGIDIEILVEQLEQKMTANTLRGRGFSPMLKAMGVSRQGMSR